MALHINQILHELPWQKEVQMMLNQPAVIETKRWMVSTEETQTLRLERGLEFRHALELAHGAVHLRDSHRL